MGYAELRNRKTARTVDVTIVLDDEWGRSVEDMQRRVRQAERDTSGVGPAATAAREELDELSADLDKLLVDKDEKTVTFRFKALSRDRYERLLAAHQPSKTQRAQTTAMGGFLQWNPDTFPPALIAACLVEPDDLSDEDVESMFTDDAWNQAELGALFDAALRACINRHAVQ
jgi:hypothetical protein